jgi:hypothetical protein
MISDLLADWPANQRAQAAKQLTRWRKRSILSTDRLDKANTTAR